MKFKVLAGSDIFEQLMAVKKRMDESFEKSKQIADEVGAEEWLSGPDGDLWGIRFPSKPNGWKQVLGVHHNDCYFPKANRQNKDLLDRIAGIPRVSRKDLNACVGFKIQWVGFKQLRSIGVVWGELFCLVELHEEANYQPLPGMEELTVSEYIRLKDQLQQARKEVAAK